MVWWINKHKHSISNVFIIHVISCFCLLEIFKAWKFGRGFFGVNFRSRDLLGVLGIFCGFDLCPHSIIPFTWNLEYPSWAHTYTEFLEVTPQYGPLQVLNTLLQGSKLKKILQSPFGDQLEKYSCQMQFFVTSLCNVNESHSS